MEGLLVIAALFFIALPLISFIMVLNANGRLKRIEERLEKTSRLAIREANANADTLSRLVAIEDYLNEGIETSRKSTMPEVIKDDKTSKTIVQDIPEEIHIMEESFEEETPLEESSNKKEPVLENATREENGLDEAPIEASVVSSRPEEKAQKLDFESLVGGRWSVLLGGFALALGMIFLVQYTIEAGLLGPGPRIVLGFLFALALFAAGEWLRRSDKDFDLPVYAKADVPGILTGAGAIGAFATLYAAHALYGFIGPASAFIGLTLIGIGTMLLSSIHGPKLAAIGVLGAYVAPLLVDSKDPNPIALALHVITVTAVVMAIARLRKWTWLAIAASIFSTLWIMLVAISSGPSNGLAGAMMMIVITAIFVASYSWHELQNRHIQDSEGNWVINFSFSLLTIAFMVQLAANQSLPETMTGLITALIIIAGACISSLLSPTALHASIIILVTILTSKLNLHLIPGMNTTDEILKGIVPIDSIGFLTNVFLLALPPALLATWGSWRSTILAKRQAGWLASGVAALAFFGLLFTYLRLAPFETRPLIGAVGMGIALLLVLLTEAFSRKTNHDEEATATAAFAVGAVSCLSLSLAITLSLGWLPLAFSLTALSVAIVYIMRPITIIAWLALAAGILAGIALWFNMPLQYPNISTTLIFNGLIILLGAPSLCLIFAGELLRFTNQGDVEFPANALTAIGLAVFGLFIAVEVVHIVNSGDLVNARQSLAETSGHALASLFLAFGLRRLGKSTGQSIFTYASLIVSAISVIIIAIGLLLVYNPFFDGKSVGSGSFFNLLMPGYLLTGLTAAGLALYSRGNSPRWYTLMYAGLSGALLFTYASLTLRKIFQGERLGSFLPTSDLEFWLYSPLWLGLGAIILSVGLRYNSLPIRAASGVLIMLTILKVFLLDMSELEGFLRAISFIGLGISLIIVGRFYQRLLTRAANTDNTEVKQA